MDKKRLAVMILCFLLGGFNILVSILTVNVGFVINYNLNDTVFSVVDEVYRGLKYIVVSSISIICLISGVVFILAGIVIFYNLKDKEEKSIKKDIIDSLLTPDEKTIIEYLNKRKGEATQKEIQVSTGFSKAKVSRVIKNLVSKKLILKIKQGMTNKIILV